MKNATRTVMYPLEVEIGKRGQVVSVTLPSIHDVENYMNNSESIGQIIADIFANAVRDAHEVVRTRKL